MISVTTVLPSKPTGRPPIVLVHGAANSAIVWAYWQRALAAVGFPSHAIDLRGHGASSRMDLAHTSMSDYASDVRSLLAELGKPAILMGWSMGGLVAMMAAASRKAEALAVVGLAPSTPAAARDTSVELRSGEFGAEEYGITPTDAADQPAMPDLDREERAIALSSLARESRYARDERAAGVVVERLACPMLIVTGSIDAQWPRSRYERLPHAAEFASVEGASHWGLVLSRKALAQAVPSVVRWLDAKTRATPPHTNGAT